MRRGSVLKGTEGVDSMAWIVSANWSPSCTAGSESLPHLATALGLATAMAAKVSVTSRVWYGVLYGLCLS